MLDRTKGEARWKLWGKMDRPLLGGNCCFSENGSPWIIVSPTRWSSFLISKEELFVSCGEASSRKGRPRYYYAYLSVGVTWDVSRMWCTREARISFSSSFNTTRSVQNDRYVASPRASGVTCRIVWYICTARTETRVLWNYFFKIITHNSGSLRMSYISAASRVGRSNTTWANFCTEFERFSSSSFPFLTSTAMEGIHGKWRDTQKNWWSIKQSSKQRRWDKGSDS